MKSVHVIASHGSGGAENFFQRLVLGLNETEHVAIPIVQKNSFLHNFFENIGQDVIPVNMRNNWDPIAKYQIKKHIQKINPDIVQTYMSRATSLTRSTSRPQIARLGGYYKLKYFQHCDYWIGNTQGLKAYLIDQGMPAHKVGYIGNFVEPVDATEKVRNRIRQKTRQQLGWAEDDFVIISMGRFVDKKGFDVLIRAFYEMNKTSHHSKLLLLGDGGVKREIENLVESLGLSSQVHLSGWVSDSSEYLLAADLLVCPSREEPLGNVILEGWAASLPVISTRTDGGCELIQNDLTGCLVDIDDVSQMAEKMRFLSENEHKRLSLSVEGFEFLNQAFSKKKIVEQYLSFYQSILCST